MIATWLRDRLWRADRWCAELASLGQELDARTPERVFELAVATEHCDPDRSVSLALYVEAARAGHALARDRACALATTLRAHLTLAELELARGELVAAGTAYLDGGFPELAAPPLERFVTARPDGASPSSEHLRLEHVTALLAFARQQRVDVEREIAGCLATPTVATYLHAERVARLAGLADRRAAVISAAGAAFPDDARIAALVEDRLFELGDADALLAHYRARFERAASRADYVERVRAAGIELLARGTQPGFGLRLLRLGLESAYTALLPEVTSHLAAWHLIWMHARQQSSTAELAPLIVQAFTAPLPEDDALYLARLGLEIAWRDATDPLAAQPYAAIVLDFVPDHPLAVAFVDEVVPSELEVTFRTPAPPPPPAPEPPKPKSTSRIPVLEEAPVKRSVSSASPAKRTSRLELLRPPPRVTKPATVPPPRAAALKRDTSPIPMAKRPARATARAERKVVPVDVVVELPSGAFFSTVLRDLSTSGAFIVTRRPIEIGAIVSLELRVPDPGKLTQTTYRVGARIARRTDLGWGVAFVDASSELVDALRAATE
jgi:hypothetical protein